MKFHHSLVKAIATTLYSIFEEGHYADHAVNRVLKQNTKWGSRDRRFIAENIYEIVRWKRRLSQALSVKEESSVLFYYQLFAVRQLLMGEELPDWEEFKGIDKETVILAYENTMSVRKFRESIPDWLDEYGSNALGEVLWEKELQALNGEAQVVLRVNLLKIAIDELQNKLLGEGVETEKIARSPLWNKIDEEALMLKRRKHIVPLDSFKKGLFEVQDASSQLIAHFLGVKEGMTVIDACAGAGGKTLHLATIMKNKGSIMAMDVEEKKLVELKKRAERAGVKIINTSVINKEVISQLEGKADRLLLDVPCSGSGVLRRNPDAKWKLTRAFIEEVKERQRTIISDYSLMLKRGGIMVYATCSIFPAENQEQVHSFLEKYKSDYALMEEVSIYPSEGFDGFYMAAIKKSG